MVDFSDEKNIGLLREEVLPLDLRLFTNNFIWPFGSFPRASKG